jgi:hypothetical protein
VKSPAQPNDEPSFNEGWEKFQLVKVSARLKRWGEFESADDRIVAVNSIDFLSSVR